MTENANKIHAFLRDCPVIDTHEHLENEEKQPKNDVIADYTRHYFNCDLISAGMPRKDADALQDTSLSIDEKWSLAEPYWENSRQTGYGQMLDIAAKTLYGVEEINRDTIRVVNDGYLALHGKPGYGKKILADVCHIERVMNNIWHLDGDDLNGLFWFVTQIDGWVMVGQNWNQSDSLARFRTIGDWADAAIAELKKDVDERGARGLKCALAYQRSQYYENAAYADAQKGFLAMKYGTPDQNAKAAQDYVMHRILRFANDRGLIVQIHTGYQEGNDNRIANSDPSGLNNLFGMYPNVRFDLFHIGYPYENVIGAMGKMYPNVRIDMCWAHIVSPGASEHALRTWLTTMPVNKIFAFGGDCLFYDGVVGHLEVAKRNVARALGALIDEGTYAAQRAETAAHMLFYDNPKAFYGMP